MPGDELRFLAARVLADANEALSPPVSEDVRVAWLEMLALVEDLLALASEVQQFAAGALRERH